MVTAEQLLAGPRGRWLCHDVATDDEAVHGAWFWASTIIDPVYGTPAMAVIRFSDDDDEVGQDPVVTPEEVAALITERASHPTPQTIARAFTQSVECARYWQEPMGRQVLGAVPVVRAALAETARRVAVLAPGCWDEPAAAEQWVVTWGDDLAAPDLAVAAANHRGRHDAVENEERAQRDRPVDPAAMFSGAWWSVPWGVPHTVARLPEALSLVEDGAGWHRAHLHPITATGRVFEIRSAADWAALCREYPLDVTASKRHDWFRTTGRAGAWVVPDWERVGEHWDGVHLTAAAYLAAAGTVIDVSDDTASVIAGWDPDATFWLTDVLRPAGAPRAATLDDDGVWHLV
ncbi:hypothetical protein [Microbacterium gorillae]|uniref:hypothetical protein n=1 Tax=Microbacterium gorillae TaxID=1231063 RepID=UPI000694B607|nr:hypothetical protein [Microbacterium gorillae]